MLNTSQQLKAIKYSIMHLEGEIRALKHAQRVNIHNEIKELLQSEIEALEEDLSIFSRVRYSHQVKLMDEPKSPKAISDKMSIKDIIRE